MILLLFLFAFASALPSGVTIFFNNATGSCPPGWSAVYSGFLVVSVTDGSVGGQTVNVPLGDQEIRTHTHTSNGSVTLKDKQISGAKGGNNQGAQHQTYYSVPQFGAGGTDLPFTQLLLCQLNVQNSASVPYGTVAYFDPKTTKCPSGWTVYSNSKGRLLVPGSSPQGTYVSSDAPLNPGEDRTHAHTYTTAIPFPSVEYVLVGGCCDDGLSEANTYNFTGKTDVVAQDKVGTTGLPYIQLLTCSSTDSTFDYTGPAGALLFNQLECPTGWAAVTDVAGRFLVSLPANSTNVGASFGGPSLAPKATESRVHTHTFSGQFSTTPFGIAGLSGCCAKGYAKNGQYIYSGTTDDGAVGLPYMEIPLCAAVPSKNTLEVV